jgi:putative photosynthetic complex assembly protein 2
VSIAGLLPPVLATVALWFASTLLIGWLANRPRATHRAALVWTGIAGIGGLLLIVFSAPSAEPAAAYFGFAGALAIWGWHEYAFLTGAVAGPRRAPASIGAAGWVRFREASAAILHHELAVAMTLALLVWLSWNTANPIGAQAFGLLFVLRLSAKLNLHAGVPNFSDELMPSHLSYLKTYFRVRPFGWPLAVSLAAITMLVSALGWRALVLPTGSGEAVAAGLLFALAALGLVEHLFMALKLRDGVLWRWALPARPAL